MSNKSYYFHDISIERYRGIKDISIDSLRRVNIIGGFNGSGKSTLLEGLFLILDRRAPEALTRPSSWRGIGFSGLASLKDCFYDQDMSNTVHLYATTTQGKVDVTLKYRSLRKGATENFVSGTRPMGNSSQLSISNDGLTLATNIDGLETDLAYIDAAINGITFRQAKIGISQLPVAAYISSATRNNSLEQATRFTDIARQGRVAELVEVISLVRPNIKDVKMLFDSGMPVLYIEFKDGKIYPAAALGDGFLTLLILTLILMMTKGGVVFLDEFDATIHYSVLSTVWATIGKLARKYDCQIFAVTHSLECVKAAVKGLEEVGHIDDLQYIRIDRSESGSDAVCYNSHELKIAASESWEIR